MTYSLEYRMKGERVKSRGWVLRRFFFGGGGGGEGVEVVGVYFWGGCGCFFLGRLRRRRKQGGVKGKGEVTELSENKNHPMPSNPIHKIHQLPNVIHTNTPHPPPPPLNSYQENPLRDKKPDA